LTPAAGAALVFLAGLLAPVKLNVLGEIYLVEVLLPVVAVPALFSRVSWCGPGFQNVKRTPISVSTRVGTAC